MALVGRCGVMFVAVRLTPISTHLLGCVACQHTAAGWTLSAPAFPVGKGQTMPASAGLCNYRYLTLFPAAATRNTSALLQTGRVFQSRGNTAAPGAERIGPQRSNGNGPIS